MNYFFRLRNQQICKVQRKSKKNGVLDVLTVLRNNINYIKSNRSYIDSRHTDRHIPIGDGNTRTGSISQKTARHKQKRMVGADRSDSNCGLHSTADIHDKGRGQGRQPIRIRP